MLAITPITMASRSDMEITLHLVQVQTSIDTTAVGIAPELGCLCPLGPLLAKRNNIVNVLLAETLIFISQLVISRASVDAALAIPPELVHALVVDPLTPECPISLETLSS